MCKVHNRGGKIGDVSHRLLEEKVWGMLGKLWREKRNTKGITVTIPTIMYSSETMSKCSEGMEH